MSRRLKDCQYHLWNVQKITFLFWNKLWVSVLLGRRLNKLGIVRRPDNVGAFALLLIIIIFCQYFLYNLDAVTTFSLSFCLHGMTVTFRSLTFFFLALALLFFISFREHRYIEIFVRLVWMVVRILSCTCPVKKDTYFLSIFRKKKND
jgi:hypothetical protein